MRQAAGLPVLLPSVVAQIPSSKRDLDDALEDKNLSADVIREIADAHFDDESTFSPLRDVAKHPNTPTDVLVEIIAERAGDDEVRRVVLRRADLPAEVALEVFENIQEPLMAREAALSNPGVFTPERWRAFLPHVNDATVLRWMKSDSSSAEDDIALLARAEALGSSALEKVESYLATHKDTFPEVLSLLVSRVLSAGISEKQDVAEALLSRADLPMSDVERLCDGRSIGNTQTSRALAEREDLSAQAIGQLLSQGHNERFWAHPNIDQDVLTNAAMTVLDSPTRQIVIGATVLSNPALSTEVLTRAAQNILEGLIPYDAFSWAIMENPSTPPEMLKSLYTKSRAGAGRTRLLNNPSLPSAAVEAAAKSKDVRLRKAAAAHPNLEDKTSLRLLMDDDKNVGHVASRYIRGRVARRLGVDIENELAIDALLAQEWWTLSPESPEVAFVTSIHRNP